MRSGEAVKTRDNLFRLLYLFIGLLPLMILLCAYYVLDPFMIIHEYQNYSNSVVPLNRDFVSTQSYIDRNEKYHYDSFIFGNSRTLAFQPEKWSSHLDQDNSPFLIDASGEGVYGIHLKIKYLDRNGANIRNALVLLCRDISFGVTNNTSAHLFIKHPELTGESRLAFHAAFLKAYLNPKFLTDYYTYKITGRFYAWMSCFEKRSLSFDVQTNQLDLVGLEALLRKDPDAYYREREHEFATRKRAKVGTGALITKTDKDKLREIQKIFAKHGTDYRIVLSPAFEQMPYAREDVVFLNQLFPGRVYDFSGKNRFTESKYNFYEYAHFRPFVGEEIMNIIYSEGEETAK